MHCLFSIGHQHTRRAVACLHSIGEEHIQCGDNKIIDVDKNSLILAIVAAWSPCSSKRLAPVIDGLPGYCKKIVHWNSNGLQVFERFEESVATKIFDGVFFLTKSEPDLKSRFLCFAFCKWTEIFLSSPDVMGTKVAR